MRLIDADALKKYMRNSLEEVRNCYPDGGRWAETITEEFCKDIDEQPTIEPEPCDDAVSRQDIYELIDDVAYDVDATKCNWYHTIYKRAKKLPSVQSEPSQVARDIADIIENEKNMRVIARSEITDEQAILHLQASGWMQRHDKEMYESGLRARLTDDSDSYDALLESAQPEIIHCKDCKWKQGFECVRFSDVMPFPDDFCSRAERRTDATD